MHFPDLEVCSDWSTFSPLISADVCGAGTRDQPIRMSAWEAKIWLTSVKLCVLSCVVSELIYGQLMGLIGQLLTILFPGI